MFVILRSAKAIETYLLLGRGLVMLVESQPHVDVWWEDVGLSTLVVLYHSLLYRIYTYNTWNIPE
ncbi:hypothetical protein DPMN_157271 [Dreissena polymorpha]|uniref:Uncharacterized protein n=1 Tax=Dreissena polymorpha TaxID=45954 RepID=A0A9D4EGX2_DREPO|nr:hypothetical protein DPMN_157271 [Dreissena polymorpha]